MNRQIKFRIWYPRTKEYLFYSSIYGYAERYGEDYEDNGVLQQFIGLKDKNGKEIYEGDIVKEFVEDKEGDYDNFTEVCYVNGSFLVDKEDCSTLLSLYHNDIEVVGNIFENPELL